MALQSVTFNVQDFGLGRAIPGTDYYSGLILFPATYPSGFSNTNKIKKFFSINEVEKAGITQALYPLEHYHISEYFRILGKSGNTGNLWVYLGDTVGLEVYNGTQIVTLQNFANGVIKQVGVHTNTTFASSLVTVTNTFTQQLASENRPLVAILDANFAAVSDLSTLPDIRALDKDYIGVVLGQDGSGVGAALAVSTGKSVTSLGTTLGCIAYASVHENIGWVSKFDITNLDEYDEPAFANGQLVKNIANSLVNTLSTLGYLFAVKRQDVSGTFHIDAPLTVPLNSDFAYIENARVIQKAIREANIELLPFTNAPIYVNQTTGKIAEEDATILENACLRALNRMAVNGEISPDENTGEVNPASVFVDREQNILASSKVIITMKITPVGVTRAIEVNIGFTPKI